MIKNVQPLTYINQGNLEGYIRMVNSYPTLSEREEKVLANNLFYKSDLKSAKQLILSNLKFVINIARSYSGYGLPQADLIQEGNIGLMKAVRRFNPKIGVRLISFAIHWIKAEIHEYVLRNWRIVKVATTKAQRKLFFNLRKNNKKIGWFNEVELEKVAKTLGVKSKDVREMESRMSAKDIAFNPTPDNDNYNNKTNTNKYIYLKDKNSNFANYFEKYNWKYHTIDKICNALKKLDQRSQDIIRSRWLSENDKSTLQELSNKYRISAERIRQLEKNAMKKMKLFIHTI